MILSSSPVATCYAELNGRIRPEAVVDMVGAFIDDGTSKSAWPQGRPPILGANTKHAEAFAREGRVDALRGYRCPVGVVEA
jgi:hypothetical protein